MRFLIFAVVFATCYAPAAAFAWGPDGHRVAGEIAWQLLDEPAREQVSRLLQVKGEASLAEAGTWADRIRGQGKYDWAAPLHYVNLPEAWAGYDEQRDCPTPGCVVKAIGTYQQQLSDRRLSESQRAEALLFLVHFVEDIHQPMHTGLKGDRGGNDVQVQFFGFETNLHALWDRYLPAGFIADWQQYADLQVANLDESMAQPWLGTSAVEWASESHVLAHSNAYAGGAVLGERYFEQNKPVVEQRLLQAGVRLADLLNTALQ
ncbi:S1/P1 nuclease [Microbulbifer sp. SA54]|uniref:S1/P1 nuclease n=1 Tax=Microbulbifer sp. SA54 TaxID=3401577 RepID=UPI003AAEDA40